MMNKKTINHGDTGETEPSPIFFQGLVPSIQPSTLVFPVFPVVKIRF